MTHESKASQYEQPRQDRRREFAALIADGKYESIDILPCGQILNGHQRYILAKGWPISNVTIRVKHE